MNNATIFVSAIVGLIVLVFVSPVISAGLGALAGWLVGSVFTGTAATIIAATGLQPYQWGAILAFAGSFFKSSIQQK